MRLSCFRVLVAGLVCLLTACSKGPQWQLLDGDQQRLSELKGQWVLINYWAEWCRPCLTEIPELNMLDKASDITVLAYNFDRLTGKALAEQAQKFNIEFASMLTEPAALFGQETPKGLPATLIINPNGEVHDWLVGPQTEESVRKKLVM